MATLPTFDGLSRLAAFPKQWAAFWERTFADGPVAAPPHRFATLVVVLVAGLVSFIRCDCPLQEPQETRYAEIPREMLAAGEVVVPRLHGQPYYDKPPLLYWSVAGCYRLFGVNDTAARLTPSAWFLCLIVTYGWGCAVAGPRAALLGTVGLCLSGRALQLGRMLTMDGLLTLAVTAAWAAAHLALRGDRIRRGWWLAAAVAVGVGLLAKGPVALALAVGPLLVWRWLDRRTARPTLDDWFLFLAVAGGVAAPWYVAAAASDQGFVEYFFWTHHVRRYLAPFDHAGPWWYYLPGLALGLGPGAVLLPLLARPGRRPAALGFFLVAAVCCLGFFSLAGCKRPAYLLPALPPLALALGCTLDAALPGRRTALRPLFDRPNRWALGAAVTSLVLASAGAAEAGVLSRTLALTIGGVVVVGGVWVGWRRSGWMWSVGASWAGAAGTSLAVLLAAAFFVQPAYAEKYGLRRLVEQCATLRARRSVPVICYPRAWDSVALYLREETPVYSVGQRVPLQVALATVPETLVFVKAGVDEAEFRTALPRNCTFVRHGCQNGVVLGTVQRETASP